MHDRLEWPLELRAVRRGYFRVGPTRLRSGDLFGFFDREEEAGRPVDGVVVYPHVYALGDLGFDSARPFGEQRGGARIYEDPSRVIGVRDYQPGDPMIQEFLRVESEKIHASFAADLKSPRRLPFNESGIFRRYPELDA